MDKDELKWIFKDIRERSDQLNEWEEKFIGDVEERFLAGRTLTENQESKLNDIYERVTENG